MSKSIEIMTQIMAEKKKEISANEPLSLNAEGSELAGAKRLTFDTLTVDVDPLR